MNFTLHQLQIFKKVVEAGSISKAAQEMNMTQPAVSIQLKNLQEQLELPLVELVGRRIRITELGMDIAQIVSEILEKAEGIEQRAAAYKGILAGTLKFGVVSTGKYLLPHFIGEFVQKHPGIKLKMDVTHREAVIQELEQGEIDFAFVSILPEHIEVDVEPILPNYLYLVAGGNFEIDENKELDSLDIAELPIIYREKGSGTRLIIEKYMDQLPKKPRVTMELTSTEAVKQAVIAGLGVSVLSLYSMHFEIQEGLIKMLKLKGFPLESQWSLIWLKKKPLSPVAKEFIKYLRANKEQMIEDKFDWARNLKVKSKPVQV